MFCPQCGQQQASKDVRFCSRCGLTLESTSELLKDGGSAAAFRKSVRQGALLLIFGVFLAPFLAYILTHDRVRAQFIPICMFLFFVAALLRILYALLFEGKKPQSIPGSLPVVASFINSEVDSGKRETALPTARGMSIEDWKRPANTAEVAQPASIAESTTRSLDN